MSSYSTRVGNKRIRNGELVATELTLNGKESLPEILKEMSSLFEVVGTTYKSKTNKSVLNIKQALKEANLIIYREAKVRAPVIKPHIYESQSEANKAVSLKNHMVARTAHGKKWLQRGIIARQVVTFKSPRDKNAQPPAQYAAAVEVGRDEFMQVVRKKPFGITGGETDFWLRKVPAMKAQPFLIPALESKAGAAYQVFASVLSKRWRKTLEKIERDNAKKLKVKT